MRGRSRRSWRGEGRLHREHDAALEAITERLEYAMGS